MALLSVNLPVSAEFAFTTEHVNKGDSLTAKLTVSETQALVDVFLLTPSSLKLPVDTFTFEAESPNLVRD